jgi:hypothetical protein
MYCICCKKDNVIPIDHRSKKKHVSKLEPEENLLWKNDPQDNGKNHTIDNEMISGGIIQIIEGGYGSTHDGDRIIIAICDDCMDVNLEDATLLYFENYMFDISDEVDKSKQKYRRRKNLDDLV